MATSTRTSTRRRMSQTVTVVLLGLATLGQAETAAHSGGRPNILFIMADDHAAHAISAYGSKVNKTPGIDRLAREGMRFTNCFNVDSLCAPSRAALITGRYNHHNGFRRNGDAFDGSQVTVQKLLQGAGYETALIGKWHLKTQPTGFDFYGVGQSGYFNTPFRNTGDPWNKGNGVPVAGYLTDVITDKAIEWMDNRDKARPFFLMVHHKAPHTPHHYPKKYEELFADGPLPLPDNFNTAYEQRGAAMAKSRGRWSKLDHITPAHFNKKVPKGLKPGTQAYKDWGYQCLFKGYLRLVAALDENIDRLLEHLDASGLAENTIVVYTSDNGFFLGDFGLFNKMWMYEESLRLPLIVRYPSEIKPGTVNDDIVSILDFAPTFLDYAQTDAPAILQGESIRPILTGNTPDDWRDAHYYHYYGQFDVPSHYGVRTSRHKLIHYYELPGEAGWELYDLKEDPRENRNLYGQPGQEEVVARMKGLLKEQRARYEGADR